MGFSVEIVAVGDMTRAPFFVLFQSFDSNCAVCNEAQLTSDNQSKAAEKMNTKTSFNIYTEDQVAKI